MATPLINVGVTFVDKGIGLIRKKMLELRELQLSIGFLDEEMATIAIFQEFGTETIPARSFLRSTLFEQRDKIARTWAKAYEGLIANPRMRPVDMLSTLGSEMVGFVEAKIRTSREWAKANAPSTVASKGFDYPLHDTFEMSQAVKWIIRKGGASGLTLATGGSRG